MARGKGYGLEGYAQDLTHLVQVRISPEVRDKPQASAPLAVRGKEIEWSVCAELHGETI